MGNPFSKFPLYDHASIVIEIQTPAQNVGQRVQGVVHLDCRQEWSEADKLWLSIKGKEQVRFVHEEKVQDADGTGRTKRTPVWNKRVFLEERKVVFDFSSGVPVGQFSFPFEFQVPSWAPPSVFLASLKRSRLRIYYKVKAEILSNYSLTRVEGERRVVVRRPPLEMAAGHMREDRALVKTLCCIDQGLTKIQVCFQSNAYSCSQQAVCCVEVDNTGCKLPVDKIAFKLKRRIWATAMGRVLQFEGSALTSQEFPGVEAGQKMDTQQWSLDLSQAVEEKEFRLTQRISSLKKPYPEEDFILSAEPLQASCIGQNMRIEYFLQIATHYGMCDCCRDLPTIKLPLTIYSDQLNFQQPQLPIPANWNPVMMQPIFM